MRTWVRPMAVEEDFTVDQSVATNTACLTGIIECKYPGNGRQDRPGKNSGYFGFSGSESDVYTDGYGKKHGICGNPATVSFGNVSARGYEYTDGKVNTLRPIYNITGYEDKVGTYSVTWNSDDNEQHSGTYTHEGRLKITQVDPNKPNHS